jgi:hypothetical protein
VFLFSIGGAIFAGQLRSQLHNLAPDLPPEALRAVLSSVEAIFTLPAEQLRLVQTAYTAATIHVLIACVPFAVLGSISSLLISKGKIAQQSLNTKEGK